MSEPEEVILDGAHRATTAIAALWRRRSAANDGSVVLLADVRGRLELFTRAIFPDAPPIAVVEPPAIPNWFARVARRTPRHLLIREAVAFTDGTTVRLPRSLNASRGRAATLTRYRLMAAGLTAKAVGGTVDVPSALEDPLVRDLYLLGESVRTDRELASELPGLTADLLAARAEAAAGRPRQEVLRPLERRVEALVATTLSRHPLAPPEDLPRTTSARASLTWAVATARALREESGEGAGPYRGLPPVAMWGVVKPRPRAGRGAPERLVTHPEEDRAGLNSERVRTLVRRPRVRRAAEDEDDDQMGMWMVQIDDPQESVEDPMGLQRPADRDEDADAGDLADSLSELPEARLVATPSRPEEVLTSEDPPAPLSTDARVEGVRIPVGVAYPEWDWRSERYRPAHAVVRERRAVAGDLGWAERTLSRHAREVERVRRQFEKLRPRRVRLGRQPDGPDIDLAACVTAHADRRAGHAVDDRLYEDVRPARREASILLLVDVSGSTDSWVADTRRIVDVEKEALLLVCEALDALGDGFAVMAFSGEGPRGVSVSVVKDFDEPGGPAIRQRIAALEPDAFTRTGAALRHATATLARRPTRHRLLLLLSDGKPNDIDVYEGRYGVEDTRRAVAEARLEGLSAFCLTVDRQAPVYLPRIFGPSGYAVLPRASMLPRVLVEVVRLLLRS